jgi:hypothetical protein
VIGGSALRRAAIVAVVAVLGVGPGSAATGQRGATVQLAYVDKTSDKVGSGSDAKPDGSPDGHFRLTVTANATITAITLRTADASGAPCCGQTWNTVPNDGLWILGVFRNGKRLNPVDEAISDPVAGTVTYDIYGSDSGFFQPSQHFVASVTFGSGGSSSGVTPGGGGGSGGGGGGGAAPPATGTSTGTVLVNGAPFTAGPIPYKSTVDVTNGSLVLKTDTGSLTVNGADGISAVFLLLRGTDKKKPIVELRLTKGDFSVCPKRRLSSVTAPPKVIRQLWAKGKGHFRTRGRYSAATVRGTNWLSADRCDGTLTQVVQGVIQVSDFPKRTQVTLRAGKSYVAKP